MNDLFKRIKINLEHRPEARFSEEAWASMEERLNTQENAINNKKQTKNNCKWVLLLLLLSSWGLSYYLYQELQLTKQEIATIKSINNRHKLPRDTDQINSEEKKEPNPSTQQSAQAIKNNDSVVVIAEQKQRRVTTPKNASLQKAVARHNHNYLTKPSSASVKLEEVSRYQSYLPNILPPQTDLSSTSLDKITLKKQLQSKVLYDSSLLDIRAPRLLPYSELAPTLSFSLDNKIVPKKSKQKAIRLGIGTGYMLALENGVINSMGITTGIKASLALNTSFRWLIECNYLDYHYHVNIMDEKLGVPRFRLISDDFDFHEAKVLQKGFEVGTAFQYFLSLDKKWSPFVSLGYQFMKLNAYETIYKFDEIDNMEDVLVTWRRPIYDTNNQHTIALSAGLDFPITKRIDWQIETYYQYKIETEHLVSPNKIGVKTSFLYQF